MRQPKVGKWYKWAVNGWTKTKKRSGVARRVSDPEMATILSLARSQTRPWRGRQMQCSGTLSRAAPKCSSWETLTPRISTCKISQWGIQCGLQWMGTNESLSNQGTSMGLESGVRQAKRREQNILAHILVHIYRYGIYKTSVKRLVTNMIWLKSLMPTIFALKNYTFQRITYGHG